LGRDQKQLRAGVFKKVCHKIFY